VGVAIPTSRLTDVESSPVPNQPKQPDQFQPGDKIRVKLQHGMIEDAVVRAVIEHTDGLKLQIVSSGHGKQILSRHPLRYA